KTYNTNKTRNHKPHIKPPSFDNTPPPNNNHPPHQNTPGGTHKQKNKVTAVHSDRETPGPIPNPEAKPASADDTTQPGWKSRTPPNTTSGIAPHSVGGDSHILILNTLNSPIVSH